MERYLVIQNFEYFGELLLREGEEIEVIDGMFKVNTSMGQIVLDFNKVEKYLKKQEILDLKIEEVVDEELEVVKNYKLVLEFKTTKGKARELENFLRQEIPKYI